MEKVINVNLYGGKPLFGGRERPLEAVITSCAMTEHCDLYKQGQCAALRSISSTGCKHGINTTKRGYTSRAMKYYEFKNKWQSHEKYNVLESNTKKLAVIENEIYFSYSFITLKVDEERIIIDGPSFGFGDKATFIPKELFTTNLTKRICDFKPQALMGGEIKAYQEEQVPLFLGHLKEAMPGLYDDFVKEHPQYDKEIDYVGRKALLHSLEPCLITQEHSRFQNTIWKWDGEYLSYESGHIPRSFIIPHGMKGTVESVRVKPEKGSTIKITSNDQVTESTKILD